MSHQLLQIYTNYDHIKFWRIYWSGRCTELRLWIRWKIQKPIIHFSVSRYLTSHLSIYSKIHKITKNIRVDILNVKRKNILTSPFDEFLFKQTKQSLPKDWLIMNRWLVFILKWKSNKNFVFAINTAFNLTPTLVSYQKRVNWKGRWISVSNNIYDNR